MVGKSFEEICLNIWMAKAGITLVFVSPSVAAYHLMDFIRKYDIELEKEHYYAGETLRGRVVIENIENLRVTGVQLFLRGKAHVEWRITRGGERRTVKEDQYFIDEKLIVWGSEDVVDDVSISILPRGDHRFPFEFQLPVTCLPCSFESRIGTVRYYLRVIIDIPYASPPQGLKYFTVIGPYIDCMDNRYTTAVSAVKQTTNKCLCCVSGPINVEASLEQTAYCCGENIRIKCEVQNGSDQEVTLFCRLIQLVEFRINKGAFGLSKDVSHTALELRCPPIAPHSTHIYHDLSADLEVPVMPPTMVEVCKVIEINYVLRVGLHLEKSSDDLQMDFPFVVATVPHPFVTGHLPEPSYEPADDHVEGGIYVSPEFQLGQVYDGGVAADDMEEEEVILYRPVYICVGRHSRRAVSAAAARLSNGHSPSSQVVTASDYPTAFADTGGCCSEPVFTDRPKAIRSSNTRQQLPSASPAAAAKAASSSSHLPAAARNGAESVERRRPMQTTAAAALKDIAMEVEDENSSSRWKAMPAEAWQAKSNDLSRTVKECHSKQPESRSQEGRTRELPEREVGTMDDHRRNSSKDATAAAAVGMQRMNSDLTKPNSVQQQQQQQRQQQRGYHHCYGTSTIALSHQSPAETRQPQPTQIGGMEGIRGREKEERKDGGRDGAKGGSEGGERKGRVMEEQGGEGKMVSTKEKYTRKEIPSSSPSSSSPPFFKSVAASKPSPSDKQREQQQPQMPGAIAAVSAVKSELTIRREWDVEGNKSKPGYDVRTSAINKQANAKIMTHTPSHDDNGNTGRYGDDGDVIGRSLMKTSLVEKCAENCRNASVEPELLPPNTRKVEKVAATGEKDVRVLRGENQKRGDAQLQSYQNYSDTRNERSERTGIGGVQSVNPTFTSSGTFTSSPSVTTSVNSTFTSAGTFTSSPSVTASVNPTVTSAGTFSSSTSITTSVNPTFTSAGTFTSIPSVTASVNPTGKVTVSDAATDTPS